MRTKITAFFMSVIMATAMLPMPTISAADTAADNPAYQHFMNTAEGSAYVWLGETIEGENIEFIDGQAMGITDTNDPLYNETVTLDGLVARKQYRANSSYFTLNKNFYDEGDTEFLLSITFYDFGPSEGKFYLEYHSQDGLTKQITIVKPGTNPGWMVKTMGISDIDLSKTYDNGANFKIINGAYNAFKKLEVMNVSRAERNNTDLDLKYIELEPLSRSVKAELETLRILKADDGRFSVDNLGKPCTGTDANALRNLITGTTNADEHGSETITQGELVKMYLESINLAKTGEESWVEAAERWGLTELVDFFTKDDAPATYYNLIKLLYTTLTYESSKGDILLAKLMQNGFYEGVDASKINSAIFQSIYYSQPRKLPYKKITNLFTGRTYNHINFFGKDILRGYLDVQSWLPDGSGFICGTADGHLYLYDINTQMLVHLDNVIPQSGYVAAVSCLNGWIYYVKSVENTYTIWRVHPKTLEKEAMFEFPAGISMGFLSVTNDGRYASIEVYDFSYVLERPANTTPVIRVDLVEKKLEYKWYSFSYAYDQYSVDHFQINPEDPNLIAFSHDFPSGYTAYDIYDRVNIMDMTTGDVVTYNSGRLVDGRTVQMVTHEVWGATGEHRWFSSWATEDRTEAGALPAVVKIDKDGTHRQYYETKSGNSVHANVSGDERMIGTDLYIRLISTETHQVFPIVDMSKIIGSKNHPYHPHPHLSYTGNKMSWGEEHDGVLGISWMDYTDILENEVAKGGRYPFGADVTRVSYKGIECESSITTRSGKECATAKLDKELFFDINPDVIDIDDGAAKITFEYFDVGTRPLKFTYTKGVEEINDAWKIFNKTVEIECENTKKWKTAEIIIDCGNFESIGKFETDFKIAGGEKSPYIANISVEPIEHK